MSQCTCYLQEQMVRFVLGLRLKLFKLVFFSSFLCGPLLEGARAEGGGDRDQ